MFRFFFVLPFSKCISPSWNQIKCTRCVCVRCTLNTKHIFHFTLFMRLKCARRMPLEQHPESTPNVLSAYIAHNGIEDIMGFFRQNHEQKYKFSSFFFSSTHFCITSRIDLCVTWKLKMASHTVTYKWAINCLLCAVCARPESKRWHRNTGDIRKKTKNEK